MLDELPFIKNIEEYKEFEKIKPSYKRDRMKIRFICSRCGKEYIKRFMALNTDFLCKDCSISKGRSSETAKEKYRKTCLEKFGAENPSKNSSIKEKKKRTATLHYGVDNPAQSKEVIDKIKQTCQERYGTDSYSKTEEYREKYKTTCIERFGVENPSQNEEIKNKKINTCNVHFNVDYPQQSDIVREKTLNTMLDRYNVEHPYQSPELLKKIKNKMIELYGVEHYSQTQEYKEKYKNTSQKQYGADHIMFTDEGKKRLKSSFLIKYGVNNPQQVDSIKEKTRQTNYKKYGAYYPIQAERVKEKMKATTISRYGQIGTSYSYYFDNRNFDSGWELAYYIWLKDHNVDFQYKPRIQFKYTYEGKEHVYFPDFLVEDKYKEIKGPQFFKDGDIAKQMVNPYDHSLDNLFEAKHQCMVKNNIDIITDCSEYINYITEKYGDEYLYMFSKPNIDTIYELLPREFPYFNYSEDVLNNDMKSVLTNINHNSGIKIIDHYFKNIFVSRVGRHKSPVEGWSDEGIIKRVISNRLQYKGRWSPEIIRQGLSITKLAPKVSVFRPYLAYNVCQKYLNKFSTVFDPFSGFGGRMLGTIAAGKKYIGQDCNADMVNYANDIIKKFNIAAVVNNRDIFESAGEYECLLTCPPYNDKENWGQNIKNLCCDDWITECLKRFKCKSYIFIVDKTEQYKDNIVETINNMSHFGHNVEYVLNIKSEVTNLCL